MYVPTLKARSVDVSGSPRGLIFYHLGEEYLAVSVSQSSSILQIILIYLVEFRKGAPQRFICSVW